MTGKQIFIVVTFLTGILMFLLYWVLNCWVFMFGSGIEVGLLIYALIENK